MKSILQLVFVSLLILITSCKSLNIVPKTNKYVGLRWGTLGIVESNTIKFYEIEKNNWKPITLPDFKIPKNKGLIFVGLGKIGVINHDKITFYSPSDDGNWGKDTYPNFTIPAKSQITSVGLGTIGVRNNKEIKFYSVRDNEWILNKNITNFKISTDGYLVPLMLDPLGIASIGIIANNKLNLYHYNTETKNWELSDLDFSVTVNSEIVSIGFGTIGIGKNNNLKFYPLEAYVNGRLIRKNITKIPDFNIQNN
ncbi:hypothetical protein [Zunongwangia sp.]|uniref:hypothetical protein n=1 Tax=Zunongwangia sp. TaxID=1965325 RepID=UPI003AA869CC